MSTDLDDDILQDFLVEAGEILEQLNGQLVDLEQQPRDADLLNAIFRGFHTIKGGGGFLGLTPLVAICHKAEDVFNELRRDALQVDATLMDVVLRAFDVLNSMIEQVRQGAALVAAPPELLAELDACVAPARTLPAAASAGGPPTGGAPGAGAGDDPPGDASDAEFDAMLAELEPEDPAGAAGAEPGSAGDPAPPAVARAGDEISEEEFERLLDELHGPGKPPAATAPAPAPAEIGEEEFDQLLDRLHGQGQPPGGAAAPPAQAPAEPGPAKPAAAGRGGESTVRVDTRRLDDIMNLVGELVLARNRLMSLRDSFADDKVSQAVANLDLVTADLQGAVMKTRMQPIKKVFGRFPRVVRDLARALHKEVELVLEGEDTDLDKNLVEALADPLVHLVRNAVDHGIEPPEARRAAGKPRAGCIVLGAQQSGDHILLSISDDGAGMDPEKLRQMAVRKGVLDAESAQRLSEKECFDLIFLPGTSTREQVSDVSGRGVGMDVVKSCITRLNGQIDIDSAPGRGTTLSIKVPLTLAILPTLMVVLGSRKFALPLSVVNEIFELSGSRTNIVDGQTVVQVRGKAPPLFHLREWLLQRDERADEQPDSQVVMVQVGARSFGLVVDQVIGQEEVVIKPLGALLQGLPGLSGATITGDGNIALILDVPGLLKAYATRH